MLVKNVEKKSNELIHRFFVHTVSILNQHSKHIILPKEEGREGGEEKACAPVGARVRSRDLPRARRETPAACHGHCLDKSAFPWLKIG